MKSLVLVPLLILLLLGTSIYMIKKGNSHIEIDNFDDGELQQSVFQFSADPYCLIGSSYKLGEGCGNSVFKNIGQFDNEQNLYIRSASRADINFFQTTSGINLFTNKFSVYGIDEINNKRNGQGGGWGSTYNSKITALNKNYESVNTVSYALTDYRRHLYKYVPASQLEIDQFDLDDFIYDPVYFFQQFGYYYVTGITTGSSFEGSLNYKSENKQALQELSRSAINGFQDDFYSKAQTSYAKTELSMKISVNGSSNTNWVQDDIKKNHDIFQNNLDTNYKISVTVSKYESISSFRNSISLLTDSQKNKLREFSKVQDSFLKKISLAYGVYVFLEQQCSDHIIQYGSKLSQDLLNQLISYKNFLNARIRFIDNLNYIENIADLKNNEVAILEYSNYAEEVERYLKQITNRLD